MDAKAAAIEQWTNDPCEYLDDGEPGTAAYAEALVARRRAYAEWFAEALDYAGSRGLQVLDVGCGQGIDVIEYARAEAVPTGVDLTPRHVELARAHLASLGLAATIVEGDAEKLPFPSAVFDRVYSNGVLHHTPNIEVALAEIYRVLKPGGEARVLVYNRNSLHYWLTQVLWQGVVHRQLLREGSMAGVLSANVERSSVGARPLVRVYSPRQVRALMGGAGFAEVATAVGGFHTGDTPITAMLASRTPLLDDPRRLDRIGRVAGWYVLGRGCRL